MRQSKFHKEKSFYENRKSKRKDKQNTSKNSVKEEEEYKKEIYFVKKELILIAI